MTLYLGRYVYEIELGEQKGKGTIDLLEQPRSVLECLGDPLKCSLTDPPRASCP